MGTSLRFKKPGSKRRIKKGGKTKTVTKRSRTVDMHAVNSYGVNSAPFPTHLLTQFKYSDPRTLTIGAGGVSDEHVYRLNSIHDPNYTTGAGSYTVSGWSAFDGIYQRYRVNGAKVTLTFNNPSADGLYVGYSLNQVTNINNTNLKGVMGYPLTYLRPLNNSGSQKTTYSFYVKPWQLKGISELEYKANSSMWSSAYNANPQKPYAWGVASADNDLFIRIVAVGAGATQAAATVEFAVTINYFTLLYDRIPITSSPTGE